MKCLLKLWCSLGVVNLSGGGRLASQRQLNAFILSSFFLPTSSQSVSRLVSHTTADLVFEWEEVLPLAVDQIELPQLQLVTNRIQDCTQVYSTGIASTYVKVKVNGT